MFCYWRGTPLECWAVEMIHGIVPPLWISPLLSGLAVDSGSVSPLRLWYIPVNNDKLSVSWEKKIYHYNDLWGIIIIFWKAHLFYFMLSGVSYIFLAGGQMIFKGGKTSFWTELPFK